MDFIGELNPTYNTFGSRSLEEIYGACLKAGTVVEASTLAHMVFLNRGDKFVARKMPAEAQFAPLLSLILIWPLLIANDAISACSENAICAEPWPSILMATCIPLIIWFALPILHPRTGSN